MKICSQQSKNVEGNGGQTIFLWMASLTNKGCEAVRKNQTIWRISRNLASVKQSEKLKNTANQNSRDIKRNVQYIKTSGWDK